LQNVNKRRDKIFRAADYITNEMLTSTLREIEYRLDVFHATNGVHTEISEI